MFHEMKHSQSEKMRRFPALLVGYDLQTNVSKQGTHKIESRWTERLESLLCSLFKASLIHLTVCIKRTTTKWGGGHCCSSFKPAAEVVTEKRR